MTCQQTRDHNYKHDHKRKRGDDSGSRLLKAHKPRPGFLVLFSASFGEQAAETLGNDDVGRNSWPLGSAARVADIG